MKKYLAFLLALLLLISAVPALADEPAAGPHPVVVSAAEVPMPKCKAALLMDGETGEVIYSFRGDEHNFPASITKVMTALLTLEAVDRGQLGLEEVITASDTFGVDLSVDGSTQGIKAGEEMTVHELLYCALVPSANEACNILAEAVAGDVNTFVDKMNLRARELGMENTHYANAHGLHNANHFTSAHDVAILVREALKNDTFAAIVSTRSHTTPATNLSRERVYSNTNALITHAYESRYNYPNAIGVKTGNTPEAGQCLASAAVKDGKTIICAVLGAENVRNADGNITRYAFVESKRLMEWGFQNFSTKTILSAVTPVKEIPVTLSADVDAVALKPQEGLKAILPNDMDPSLFEQVITLYQDTVEAPVEAGQVLGELTVRNGDTTYGTVKLVAAASAKRSDLLYRLDQVKKFFGQKWVKLGLLAAAVLIIVLILRFGVFGKRKRRRYGRSYPTGRRNYTGRRR